MDDSMSKMLGMGWGVVVGSRNMRWATDGYDTGMAWPLGHVQYTYGLRKHDDTANDGMRGGEMR